MTAPPLLAAAVVLFAAAAGTGDYMLTAPPRVPACAKSRAICEAAQAAIRKGWLPDIARDAPAWCDPAPGCFSPRSLCCSGDGQ